MYEIQKMLDPIFQFLTNIWMVVKPFVIEILKTVITFVIELLNYAETGLQSIISMLQNM